MGGNLRKTGIDIIGDVPWGMHLCHFYQTEKDLAEILVPYFRAGLANNEFCVWVTSEPLDCSQATEAMIKAMPDFERYLNTGQIALIPHTEWYLKEGVFDIEKVALNWEAKLNKTLAAGYEGMRVAGNMGWAKKKPGDGLLNMKKI